MDHANVFSGAAFKTAVRATGILLVILTLASVTAYFYLQRQMLGALEDQINEDRMALNQIYLQGGQFGLIGVIDESDILLRVHQDASQFRLTVAGAMTDKLQTLPPGASLAELQAELDRGLVAIIADASGFHGLITRFDMLNHLRRSLA